MAVANTFDLQFVTSALFPFGGFLMNILKYDVKLYPSLLDPRNHTLATYLMPETTVRRRFLVIDQAVQRLYGDCIKSYFESNGVNVIHSIVIPGEEENKRMEAV